MLCTNAALEDVRFTFFVCQAGDNDHATWSRLLEQIEKTVGEEKVSQVVHTKLHFKAILSLPFRAHHDT